MKQLFATFILSILFSSTFAQINLTDSLFVHLPLDNTTNDVSGNNNNAIRSLTGVYGTSNRIGIIDGAMLFNGDFEAGLLDFGTPLLNGRTQLTTSFWFNITNAVNAMSMFGQDNLFEVAFYTGPNRISIFHPTSGTTNINLSSTLNVWQHIAITTSNTQMRVFINGILMATINGNHVIGTNTTNTRIGGNVINQSNNSFLRGMIDELRLYSRVLNLQEIENLSSSSPVTLITNTLPTTNLCAGSTYRLPYQVFGSGIISGNKFIAQLSDENGLFNSPIVIGERTFTGSDTITITIPDFVSSGSNYKLRIVSTFPMVTGNTSIQTYQISNVGDGLSTLKRNRLLWYQFNTNTGDSSGNGFHATLSGGATYGLDRFGNPVGALQLNGVSAFAAAPANVWFSGPFTVSCWVRPNSITNWARLFDFGNGSANDNVTATLFQSTNNRQQAETYIGSSSSGFALTNSPGLRLNQWNHYLIQYDGTVMRIYIDGVLAASANSGIPRLITRNNCWIGRSNWAADAFANALFDDFMLFNRALSTDEIQVLANDGLITHNPIPCAGNMLQLSAPSLQGATYQWSGPNGFVSSLRQPIIANVSTVNSGSYQLVIKQGLCDSIVANKTINIINAANQSVITFNSLPTQTNTGLAPITLTATPANGIFSGNGIMANTFNPQLAGEGTHIVLYSVQHANGCFTNRPDTTITFPSYNMTNTNTFACSGGFYDAEGSSNNYSSNQSIIHTFYSGSNLRLQFNFSSFGLGSGDTLFVFDGPDTSSMLIAYYISNSASDVIWSKDSSLTFWFKSDGNIVGSGWNASFTCMQNPVILNENILVRAGMQQSCTGVLLDPGGTGNYSYGYWEQTIRASAGSRLRYTSSMFNVNGNNGGHWLTIYDGPTTSSPIIGSYNNFNFIPAFVESTGEYLTFAFNANNTNASLQPGFSGNLSCTTPVIPVIINNNSNEQTCNAVWYDQGGSAAPYSNNLDITQSFVSTNGNKLRFTFNPIETQIGTGDTLFVYDGPDTTAQLLSVHITGSNFEPIKSKDSTITFKFKSNNTINGRGWQSFVSCVPSHALIDTFALSNGIRYSCNAIIRDPGGTNNYSYGFWRQTYGSYNGNRIRLDFTELNINPNGGGHWLTIYDGPDASFPVIGSYNESNPPPNNSVESSGRFLTIELNTNNTNASLRAGFTANLSCTTPILQVYNMQDTTIQTCSGVFYDDAGAGASYSNNRNITQTFCSNNGQRIQFVFNRVTTELNAGDTLWVYDGSQTTDQLLGVYIGGTNFENLISSGTCLTFSFKSNNINQGRGWQAIISCISTAPATQDFALSNGTRYTCNAVIRDPGGTNNYSYGFWRQTYGSYNGNRIRLNFSELNINPNGGGHWLTIYDGPDASFPVIGSYNESNPPLNNTVESSGRFLTIELNTNNTNASLRTGFTATLTCTTPILEVFNMRDTTVQSCNGIFYDDGGANSQYNNNRNLTQTFCSNNSQRIQFNFNSVTTELNTGDTLWVYDGSQTTSQLLGVYIQGSTIETLTSSGTCLTFTFKSNATTQGRGWQAIFNCVTTVAAQQTFALNSGVRYSCNAIIRDPGGTNNYSYGFWRQTYGSYNGNRIRLDFTELNINPNGGGHWLTIYDGPDASFPVIGSYNETNLPPNNQVESTGRFLTIELNTNNTNAGLRAGFTALLSCTTPILEVINMRDTTIQTCNAVFYDQGGASFNYGDNLNQTITLVSSTGQPLQVAFNPQVTQLNTGDTLRIFDGSSTTSPLLGVFINGSTLETVVSSGTALTFRFTSNGTLNSRGWQGYVSCVTPNTNPVSYIMSAGERFTCNGVFTDPGGSGNYPYGTFTQTFTSYSGQRIRAVRTSFAINSAGGGHFLDVYDGTSINAPLIGTYNNSTLPPTALQSTGSSLTFRLRSSNTNASLQSGFSFNLSCFTGSAVDVGWVNSQVCQGAILQVPFVRNNPVQTGNIYTVQLSDSSGNFGSPVNIGTLTSTDSTGTINAIIPLNTIPGGNYRVRVTTSNPIANGSSSPNSFSVNRLPTQPSSINVNGSTSFCFGTGSTQLSINPQPNTTYRWLRNDTIVGGNSPTFTATQAGTYRVRLITICDSITSSSSVVINSISTPTAPTITTNGTTQICSNGSVQLSIPVQSGVTYQWKRDTNNVGTNTNSFTANQAGSYQVIITNSCGSVASINQIQVNIIGSQPTTPSVTSSSTALCSGDSVLLSTAYDAGLTYQWRFNGNNIGTDTNILYAKAVGNYTVSVQNTCGSASSSNTNITQNQTTQITQQPTPALLCAGNSITLTATAIGQGTLTYQWFKQNIALSGEVNNSLNITNFNVNDTGLYKLRVTGGCGQLFSNEVRLSLQQPGIWTGAVNADWNLISNWSCPILPDSNMNVIIPSNASVMPAINSNAACKQLTIQNNATLNLTNAQGRLSLYGNLILQGNLNHLLGWINLTGNQQQILPSATYHKLAVNNPLGIQLSGAVSITDSLWLISGMVNLSNHQLTLSGTSGNVVGYDSSRYIRTNGSGTLNIQQIGSTGRTGAVVFPIGLISYNPAIIQNTGSNDVFGMRLLDSVFNQYSGFSPIGNALVSTAVSKTWLITEGTNGGSNVNLTLQWNSADELTAFSRNSCFVAQYNGSTWVRLTTGAASGNNPYQRSLNNITSFNTPFGVGSGNVLPVQLISFNGINKKEYVELNWSTAWERNNKHFILERDDELNQTTKIMIVEGKGNSNVISQYQYKDYTQLTGVLVYRLLQVDYNGNTIQTGQIMISRNTKGEVEVIEVYPNPANNVVYINLPATDKSENIEITDATGRVVKSIQIDSTNGGRFTLPIDDLNSGVYMINYKQFHTKLVKE